MSGPKCTDYELERRRREEEARRLELERRRREEERRRREEEERRRREAEERRRQEEERRRREEERKRQASLQAIGSMQERLKNVQGEMRSILRSAEYEAETRDASDIIGALQSDIKEIDNGIRPYSSAVLDDVLKKEKEISNLKNQKEKNLVQYRNEQENWRKQSGETISKALDELFKDEKGLMTKQETEELERKKQEENKKELRAKAEEAEDYFEELLQETAKDPEAGKKIKEQYEAFRMQVQAGEYQVALDYYVMKKNSLNRLREESLERQKAKENLELLYIDALISYETACEMAGVTPQTAEHTEEGIRFMRQETIRVESELLAQREVQIIRQEIAAVMEELGYEVIGSREAERKGTKIRHQIFSYGNGTAIDVMESGGQITMEIVGMEEEDRMPTEKEKDFLEEKMVTFCGDFDKVEDVLKERHGIVVKTRHHKLNPSREYARILNISNFDMQKDVDTISGKRTRPGAAKNRKRSAAGQEAKRWQE